MSHNTKIKNPHKTQSSTKNIELNMALKIHTETRASLEVLFNPETLNFAGFQYLSGTSWSDKSRSKTRDVTH